jgi:hypothetical protein
LVNQNKAACKVTLQPAQARTLSVRNCEAVIGQGWRWAKEHAIEWGVPIITIDRKRFIDADQFLAAMAKASETPAPGEPSADPTATVFAALGWVKP